MLEKVREGFRRATGGMEFLGLIVSMVINPTANKTIQLENCATKLAAEEDLQRYLRALRSAPATARMLAERYLPEPYRLEDLDGYPEGTLGYVYRRHMLENGIKADFFTPIDPGDDEHFFRLRLYQTHDVWHVLTGYPISIIGEMSIVGFYLGHFDRYIGKDAWMPMTFTSLLASTTLLHIATRRSELVPDYFRGIFDGYTRGKEALPLFHVRWEHLWDRKVEDLRREFRIRPSNLGQASSVVTRPSIPPARPITLRSPAIFPTD